MPKPRQNKWLKAFEDFIPDLRIKSKEVHSDDPRGSPLVLWESQRRFVREVGQGLDDGIHIFNCGKSRQLGITTVSLALADVFWMAVHDNMIGALVTDTDKNKKVNRELIEHYVNSFEEGYFGGQFGIVNSNRDMIKFSNGSRLDFLVAGTRKKPIAWAQGVGYAMLHCTEVAAYGDVEGLKSLEEGFAQNNPHRLLIMESTSNGWNHWRQRWIDGREDLYTQRSFFVGWWAGDTNRIERSDPRFLKFGDYPATSEERELIRAVKVQYQHAITVEQLAWIRWKESGAGNEQDLLAQNQPWTIEQSFVQTGYSFFEVRTITKDIKRIMDGNAASGAYRFKGYRYNYGDDFFTFTMEELDPSPDNADLVELKVWEEPQPRGRYVVGFDPGYGNTMHGDAAVIVIWRCYADKMIQVAEYCTRNVDIKHTTWVFFHLCMAYGDAMGNYDVVGPGKLVISEFKHLQQLLGAEHNAPRVAARNWTDAGANVRHYLYGRADSLSGGLTAMGFESSWRSKGELMHGMRSSYVTHELEIKSRKLLAEMAIVVVNDDVIGAPDSADADQKDDRVIATALATKAWKDWVRKEMLSQAQTYDAVTAEENGDAQPLVRSVNSIVYRFLARKQEEADNYEEPRGDKFHIDNGLV